MAELILYDAANSPCARRVRMCLIEKGVPFEIRWMGLGLMDQKQAWYLKLNPNGLVPTLVHGERALYESNVINEYLDATFPAPPLVPKDAYLQAQMRMWMAFELDWAKPFRDAIYETMSKRRLQDTGITPEKLAEEITKRTPNKYYLKFATQVLTTPEEHRADRRPPPGPAREDAAHGGPACRRAQVARGRRVHPGRHRARAADRDVPAHRHRGP